MKPVPILTPAQQAIINQPNIQELLTRFDCLVFSSPEGISNLKIHHRVQEMIAKFSNNPPPPPPDFSNCAPLSNITELPITPPTPVPDPAIQKIPPGYILSSSGKLIFDMKWQSKNIHPTQLPKEHPDYCPF